jgi:hypothetical protein
VPDHDLALSTLVASDLLLSPELVLVSPPEVARQARELLPYRPPSQTASVDARPRIVRVRPIELCAVWLFCLAMTAGPVLFLILAASG